MKNFKGKVAAITGAGSGIGQQLAVLLAKEGCNLSLSDVSEAGLAATVELVKPFKINVTTQKLMCQIRHKLLLGRKKPLQNTVKLTSSSIMQALPWAALWKA